MASIAIIIVPLPSGVLDFFLTISFATSVLLILVSLYIQKQTDLNTATRMILRRGNEGTDSVSAFISRFGQVENL